jgi:alpha-mannosidase
VAFLTDSKYGWHVRDNVVQLSLLRSPKNPDGNCDMHRHFIHYAVLPHEGRLQEAEIIQRAYEFNFHSANNVPLLTGAGGAGLPSGVVTTSEKAVIVEALKPAHDVPGAVVVRLYEAHGGAVDPVTLDRHF